MPDTSTCEFEVPELFEWNGRWYLTYTTYIESTGSHYRMADQVTGPWLAPAVDSFDDNNYYAAKTVSHGKRRFAFGFIPTGWKSERADGSEKVPDNARKALAIREVTQRPDGSLAFQCPPEILRSCGPTIPAKLQGKLGEWSSQGRGFRAKRVDGLAYGVAEDVPADLLVELVITLKPSTRSAGVLFRTTPDLARGYMLRLEPNLRRVVFDHWPKGWPRVRGEHPFTVQRPLNPPHFSWEKPITVQLLIHGTIAEVFVDNQVALVTRIYDHKDGDVALFVENGEAEFEGITFKSLP
jgi:beta-fructofuranosidase